MKPRLLTILRTNARCFLLASSTACLGLVATPAQAQNPAATYVWVGGNQFWSIPANWGTADVPNNAGVAAKIDGGKNTIQSLVSVNGSFTVGALTIDPGDGVIITDGSRLTIDGSSPFTGAGTLGNSGSVTLQGSNFGANLTLSGSVTLSGGGTITLIPSTQINGDNATLTNVDNTIEGYSGGVGNDGILANNLTIINEAAGIINANVSGRYLTINPRAGTLTNSGLLEATNGGILDLDGGYGATFTNVGTGTMQAQDGSSILIRGSNIVGGTLLTAGTGTILLESGSLTNVTNAGAIIDSDGEITTLAGTLTNRGSILCTASQGDGGAFALNGDVTLNGGGTITLARLYHFNGTGTLTNVDNTIEGLSPDGGGLGGNQIAIVNGAAGVINANVSGQTLDVDPGTGGLTNAGLMEATNGGSLRIDGNYGQGFTNVGAGTMLAADGSIVLIYGADITGGTLSTGGSGLIQIYRGGSDSGFTNVTSTGSLFVDGTVDLTGTFTNSGSVTFGGNGGNGGITINTVGNVALNGAGLITMTSGSQISGDGGTLTNADNTIQGFGNLGFNQIGIVNGAAGVINANVSGQTLDVDPAVGGLTNAGLMEAGGGGILFLDGNFGQGFTNRSEFRVNDGGTINASQGIITNLVNGTLTGGTYRVFSTTSAATTLSFGGTDITANAATIVLSGVNSAFADLGTLSDNRGSLSLLGLRDFTTAGVLSNEGTLVLGAGSTLHTAGAFTASSTSILAFTVGGTATQGAQSPGVLQVNGAAIISGNLAVSFSTAAALPAIGDTLTVLAASSPVTGSFANAASGGRVTTTDGKGSFLVTYGANTSSPNAVTLSRFLLPGQTDLPTAALTASVASANANEGIDGSFLLTLSAAQNTDIVVNLQIKGTAVNGTDYTMLMTTKKIKAGKTSKSIVVVPVDESFYAGGKKTVKITLLPGTGYSVGSTTTAKVKILYDR